MLRLIAVLLLLLGLALAPAAAQDLAKAAPNLDGAKSTIDAVEARLARGGVDDALLQQLRGEVDPLVPQLNDVANGLAPRIAAVKDRLAQLGPAPDGKGGPGEAPAITAERAAQQKLYDDLDATAKRARVLSVQAQQLSDDIVARRRSLFARDLFARSAGLLSPGLWSSVVVEIPDEIGRLGSLLENWFIASRARLSPWEGPVLAGLLGLIALAYYPLWRVAVRVRSRHPEARPGRLNKALAALRVTAATAAVPVGAALLVVWLFALFDLPSSIETLSWPIVIGVAAVSVGTGLARGLYAPKSPNWRLLPLDDTSSKTLYHLTIAVTVLVAAEHVVSSANELVGAGVPTAISTRILGALSVAIAIAHALRKGVLMRRKAGGVASHPRAEHAAALLRLFGRCIILFLLGAVLIGYVAFAAFMIDQLLAVAATLGLLYVVLIVSDEGFSRLLGPDTTLGRGLAALFGFQADGLAQIAILLSGLVRVTLYIAAVLLVLAPWRIESGDMIATVEAAVFGFSIGGATISIFSLAVATVLFAVALGISKAIQRWLETRYLPRTRLDSGLQNSLVTSFGYVGFVVALGLALAYLGLSWERLTLVAGGLSLGIGLGLQTVTNNFVSGLILLWERAIRVGDMVEIGSELGFVRRINVRSTEIETYERALVIMPNASLMSGVVKNWVRNDRIARVKLTFTLPVSADPEEVRTILIGCAKAHDRVLTIPVPSVLFTTLGEASMSFDLIAFVDDVESRARVTSDLLYEIHGKLKARGYIAPPAAPVVSSPALDKLDAWLTARFAQEKARDAAAE